VSVDSVQNPVPQARRRSPRGLNSHAAAQPPATGSDRSGASASPSGVQHVNVMRKSYGADDAWFSMREQGWPTLRQSADVSKLPQRSQTTAAHAAVAKALAAVTLVSSIGTASAQPIVAETHFMHDDYGRDFAAYALALGSITALYIAARLLFWCCRTKAQSRVMHFLIALAFVALSWANSSAEFSTSAIWAKLRNSPVALNYVIALIPAVPLCAWWWISSANRHFNSVRRE
jgi:hypothetical protein